MPRWAYSASGATLVLLTLFLVAVFTAVYQSRHPAGKYDEMGINELKEAGPPDVQNTRYVFNCANLDTIKLMGVLGSGSFKTVYLGTYGSGSKVAVKVTKLPNHCPHKGHVELRNCLYRSLTKVSREIDVSLQLSHPNILPMLGYCHRSRRVGTESLSEEGLVSVYDYGEVVHNRTLIQAPVRWRLDTMVELMDLMMYMDASPMGSLQLRDLRTKHFVQKNGKLLLIDLEGMQSLEPFCDFSKRSDPKNRENIVGEKIKPEECHRRNLSCTGNRCVGYNAVYSMERLYLYVFRFMLDVSVGDKTELGPRNTILVNRGFATLRAMLQEPANYKKETIQEVILQLRKSLT